MKRAGNIVKIVAILVICAVADAKPLPKDKQSRAAVFAHTKLGTAAARGAGTAWPVGSTLQVYFKNGNAERRTKFAQCVSEWSKYGNFLIQFHPEPMPKGVYAILVQFNSMGGGMSHVGAGTRNNQAASVFVPYDEPSCKVFLHEFGHTLGLRHEFENPSSIPFIDVSKSDIYSVLNEELQWDRRTADRLLLKRVVPAVQVKPFDPASVMGYTSNLFPGLYKPEIQMEPSETLSEGDKAYIAQLYPGKTSQATLPFSFNDDSMTPVETVKQVVWTQQNLSLRVPASFNIQEMTEQRLVMSNPSFTNEAIFEPGVGAADIMALKAKQASVFRKTLNGLPVKETSEWDTSESASQVKWNIYGYGSTVNVIAANQPVKYFRRSVVFQFKNGPKFTGYFLWKVDDTLKEQVDAMHDSLELQSSPTSPAAAPSGDAVVTQCGRWLETYRVRPYRSWGSTTGEIQRAWDASDCNHKVCQYLKDKYGIIPNKSLGILPVELQAVWNTPEIDCPNNAR